VDKLAASARNSTGLPLNSTLYRDFHLMAALTEAVAPAPLALRRIFVPIDFSPCSAAALRYAVPLARQFRARIGLIYVGQEYYFTPSLAALDASSAEVSTRANSAARLAEFATKEISNEVPVDILVRNGNAADEIVRAAGEFGADLIIISTHGYSGWKHTWFGSTAETLVRHAKCPVLVVKGSEHDFVSCRKLR
jgi:nucleotide-binding universal stress UspA family protein